MTDELLTEIARLLPGFEVEWREPPPSRQGQHERKPREGHASWQIVASLLRIRPGQWLRIGPFTTPAAFGSQGARMKAEGFEAVSRTETHGAYFVYVRWPS